MSIRAMNLEGGSSVDPAPKQGPKPSSHQQDPLLGIPVIGSIVKNATDQFVHSSTVQSIVKDTTSKEVNPNYKADCNQQIAKGNQANTILDNMANLSENQHSNGSDIKAIGYRFLGKLAQADSYLNAANQVGTDASNQVTSYINAGSTLVNDTTDAVAAAASKDVNAATSGVKAELQKSGAAQAYADGQNNANAIKANFDNTVQADLSSISFSGPATVYKQTLDKASAQATQGQNYWNAQAKNLEQQGGTGNDIQAAWDRTVVGNGAAAWNNAVGHVDAGVNRLGDAGNALANGYVSANAAQNDIENTAVSTAGSLITNAWNTDTTIVNDLFHLP